MKKITSLAAMWIFMPIICPIYAADISPCIPKANGDYCVSGQISCQETTNCSHNSYYNIRSCRSANPGATCVECGYRTVSCRTCANHNIPGIRASNDGRCQYYIQNIESESTYYDVIDYKCDSDYEGTYNIACYNTYSCPTEPGI